jgi:hypothetical protein
VAYLNTSYSLLPPHSNNEDRATIVVSGFHGLQLYANQFWVDHALSYCTIIGQQRTQLSHELLSQLNTLLGFLKDSADFEQASDHAPLEGLDVLDQHPKIKTLVLKLTKFRADLETDDASHKSDKSAAGGWMTCMNEI